jgi:hypothetical protein
MGKCKCKCQASTSTAPTTNLEGVRVFSATVTSNATTIFNPPIVQIVPMQVVTIDTSVATGPFQYGNFDTIVQDPYGMWDQSLLAFRIRRAGRYNVSTQLTYLFLANAPNPTYPDGNFIMFEVRDANDNIKFTSYIVGVTGIPLFIDNGVPINSPMSAAGIIDVEVGDLVRVRAKSVNVAGNATGTLILLGRVLISGGAVLAGSAEFSICEC